MADVQQSGPLVGENLTDEAWRAIFGAETGITNDWNGTAFNLTTPPSGDDVEIGSATADSTLVVGGFMLRIPQGTTQSLEIPQSSNAGNGRTDLIVARLDADSFSEEPGPVRLHRIAGVEGSATRPSPSTGTTGVLDLPLYAITRKQGESLPQATVTDMRTRLTHHHLVPQGAPLPPAASLGDRATRDGVTYRCDRVGSAVDWVRETPIVSHRTGGQVTEGSAFPGWITGAACSLDSDGFWVKVHIEVEKNGSLIVADSTGAIPGHTDIVTVRPEWTPPVVVSMSGYVENDGGNRRDAGARILTNGRVVFTSTQPGAGVRRVVLDAFYPKGA